VHTLGHNLTAHIRDGRIRLDANDVHADVQERCALEPRVHADVVAKAVNYFVKRRLGRERLDGRVCTFGQRLGGDWVVIGYLSEGVGRLCTAWHRRTCVTRSNFRPDLALS